MITRNIAHPVRDKWSSLRAKGRVPHFSQLINILTYQANVIIVDQNKPFNFQSPPKHSKQVEDMPKQGVIPDELTKPFWDAANDERLVIQSCKSCDRLQHPPSLVCGQCRSGDNLEWKEMTGRAKIYNYCVVYDCPIASLKDDIPFNLAVVMLDEDPGIQMYSHLPGTPVDDVPVGADVEVVFEATTNGQKVPEWRVAG